MNSPFNRLAVVAVVSMGAIGLATADQWDKKTTITIDEAMKIPNTTLEPGTYVVKLADLGSQRHIVQFFDKDGRKLITTVLAIPNEPVRPTDKSVFSFWEVPAGQPKALRAWFYPGDNFGQEFAYPKDEAAQITAANSGANVPVSDENPAELAKSAPADKDKDNNSSAISAAPGPVADRTPAPAATPAPEPVVTAAAAPQASPVTPPAAFTPADQPATTTPTAPQNLPQTASKLPLFSLIGFLSLLAAVGLNFAYNRA